MPMARARMATAAKPGERRRLRAACVTSVRTLSIHALVVMNAADRQSTCPSGLCKSRRNSAFSAPAGQEPFHCGTTMFARAHPPSIARRFSRQYTPLARTRNREWRLEASDATLAPLLLHPRRSTRLPRRRHRTEPGTERSASGSQHRQAGRRSVQAADVSRDDSRAEKDVREPDLGRATWRRRTVQRPAAQSGDG